MAKLTCKKPFDIGTQKVNGTLTLITAEIGDTVEVNVRNRDEFYIIAIYKSDGSGKIKVFSTWMRKNWILNHCD